MDNSKVNMYLARFNESVPKEKIFVLKSALEKADESCESALAMVTLKNPIVILLMSLFFGGFGVDRFMLGDIGLGVCKLLFGWITLGIWPLVDIFITYKKAKEINLQNILIILNS